LFLLGYSWGAYLAARYALEGTRTPDGLILVNPYLVVENRMPFLTRALLRMPGVGSALLRASLTRNVERFLTNVFKPGAAPEAYVDDLRKSLSHPEVWKGAASYKAHQQAAPLATPTTFPCRVLVLRGEDDAVASWTRQREVFDLTSGALDERTYSGAGHGLPWTHGEEVATEVRRFIGL
jgi:pimeloyl-ACP methyl ester carboxylesterase